MSRTVHCRKVRSDSKLGNLPEEKRPLIEKWINEGGMKACLAHIQTEFGIEVKPRAVYYAIAYWNTERRFYKCSGTAHAMAKLEGEERELTPTQMEEAADRNFILMAQESEDQKHYSQMRYLRIADQESKARQRIAQAKVKHGAKALRQKDKALTLAERKVVLLEKKIEDAREATADKTLGAEERAARIREILQ